MGCRVQALCVLFPLFGVAALTGLNAAVVIAPGVAVSAAREPQMRVLLKQGNV